METLTLKPHPDHPPAQVTGVEAAIIGLTAYWLRIRWRVAGAAGVLVPPFAGKDRADGLWQETCFELFVKEPGANGYAELNFSPSERWAAYDFAGYRSGMANRPMPRDPDGTIRIGRDLLIFDASIPLAGLPPLPWRLGISAVIEEEGGRKSYWALAHPPGSADFHSPACFAASLAPPTAP
ncbi:MAG: DOMON-like domain-containing protein [Pseudomonadota bacterium]